MAKGGSSGGNITAGGLADLANKQAKLGEEWLAFSKEQFGVSKERQAELDAITKQVTQLQLDEATRQSGYARADRERYEQVYRPIEDQFISEATNYASEERQNEAAATAKADVTTALADAKAQSERQAMSMGVDPNSGRFAGIQRSAELGGALATAGAQNAARQQVRDKGLALKGEVVNLGRGLPNQSATASTLGLNAGSTAIGLNQNNQNIFNNSPGIVGNGFGGAAQGYSTQLTSLSNLYNAQQSRDAQNTAGLWGALGTVAGAALPVMLSSKELKEDKAPIEDGAALEAVKSMPVESWKYKEGVADEGEHVGPYAEDFADATGTGDGTSIGFQDAVGLTMRAVQDLDQKVDLIAQAVGLGGAGALAAPTRRRRPAPREDLSIASAPGLAPARKRAA